MKIPSTLEYFWSRYHDTQLHIWQHYNGLLIWWTYEWCIFHKKYESNRAFFSHVKISSLVAVWIANKSAIFSLMNRWHDKYPLCCIQMGLVWGLHIVPASPTLESISGIVQVKYFKLPTRLLSRFNRSCHKNTVLYPKLLQNIFRIVALGDGDFFLVLHNFYSKKMHNLAYIYYFEFFDHALLESIKIFGLLSVKIKSSTYKYQLPSSIQL